MDKNQINAPTFETWAFVELYGHRQLAGKATEQQVAGTTFLRLDVPEENGQEGFTRLFGAGAIYSITPCTEFAARAAIRRLRPDPLPFYIPELVPQRALMPAEVEDEDEEWQEEDQPW